MYILGISAFYHDSAACLIKDGEILAAAQEERFTRIKHDSSFPINAVKYCLDECGINLSEVGYISYYENSAKKFSRLIQTYLGAAPLGIKHFTEAMRVWLNKKLFIKSLIFKELKKANQNYKMPKFDFFDHHHSHAASSFYPSPFKEAAILCMDGVGEWATTSAWIGNNNEIKPLWEIKFPHSIGLLYSAFTSFCGFKVNSGEYKLMGLAPYGKPIYADIIKKNLIDIKDDGSFKLNLKYFSFYHDFKMTNNHFSRLFDISPREPETQMSEVYMDLAASIQQVTNDIVMKLSRSVHKDTGIKNLCLSGGVALNCVANGKLLNEKFFDEIWIQPAAGDAGSSLGAALLTYHNTLNKTRVFNQKDSMKGSYLGPSYSKQQIYQSLKKSNLVFSEPNNNEIFEEIAEFVNQGNVVGLFNGRMEFGPRALGGRSIIADPRNVEMQSKMNLKIKFRESFRPFAPAIIEEECKNYFELNTTSPYMLLVANLKKEFHSSIDNSENNLKGFDKLKIKRSEYPAITHVDYSARIQTVNETNNSYFYSVLKSFKKLTGCPMLINTSFNIRGEPIVNSLEDAIRCFMQTNMDILVIENFIIEKDKQNSSSYKIDKDYQIELD